MTLNPILLEVFKNRFSSIAEEMGMALMRTAYSPNIKERRDFSCALFDAEGEMVATPSGPSPCPPVCTCSAAWSGNPSRPMPDACAPSK